LEAVAAATMTRPAATTAGMTLIGARGGRRLGFPRVAHAERRECEGSRKVLEAQANNLLVGLVPDLIDKGVAIMQYDDTVLCITHDPQKAINLKLLIYVFELMSGLKINNQKSEIFLVGVDNIIADYYSSQFGCQVGTFPMKYLGVPVTHRTL
jgi:hypothetical protein